MFPKILVPLSELDCDYARSSGPGGQNVNKVNSKCVMKWLVAYSHALPIDVRSRFMQTYGNRINQEGVLVVMSDRFRDQKRNYDDCVAKVQAMIDAVSRPPKIRRDTQPTRGSKRRRETDKRAHSEKKAFRREKL